MISKLIAFQKGKKTYAIVAVGIALGIAQHFGWHVPAALDWVLGFLGLGTLRAAVQAQSAKAADDIADLVQLALQNLTETQAIDPNAGTTGAIVKDVPVEVHVLPDVK